jgi:hypothetical protein
VNPHMRQIGIATLCRPPQKASERHRQPRKPIGHPFGSERMDKIYESTGIAGAAELNRTDGKNQFAGNTH